MNLQLKSRIIAKYGKQWVFAREIGVHDSVVSKVVTGARELPADQIQLWAEKLDCDINEIFPQGDER